MRLIDNDGKRTTPMFAPYLVENEREFLHGRNYDLLAAFDEPTKIARVVGMTNGRTNLKEILDGLMQLAVEYAPIGHNDH
jgi:hypothetical protein